MNSEQFSCSFPPILLDTVEYCAIDKPSGWLSVPPAHLTEKPILSVEVKRNLGENHLICHRLDVDTTGVILFAKNPEAHRKANGWFERGEIKKTYLAWVLGPRPDPLFRSQEPIGGKRALTLFMTLKSYVAPDQKFFSLIEARPKTGRRHQIRIHLAQLGIPLLQDRDYGGCSVEGINRTALHACGLELPDKVFKASAPLPFDFLSFENLLKKMQEEE